MYLRNNLEQYLSFGSLIFNNYDYDIKEDLTNLGNVIRLVPVPKDELEEYSDDERSCYHYLYKDDKKLSDAFFRKGGMCNGFKDGYCSLIEYDPINRKSGSVHVIIDINGDVVLESNGLDYPSHIKGNIGYLKGFYYNLKTCEIISKGNKSFSSEEYLFVENRYNSDYEEKESGEFFEIGIYKIHFETCEIEYFK
jgi:hypothetical protein